MIYIPKGVCSRAIDLDISDDGIIKAVHFIGGCDGNAKGISALVKGLPAADVIERLDGITCGNKATSCPDQLATALKQFTAKTDTLS